MARIAALTHRETNLVTLAAPDARDRRDLSEVQVALADLRRQHAAKMATAEVARQQRIAPLVGEFERRRKAWVARRQAALAAAAAVEAELSELRDEADRALGPGQTVITGDLAYPWVAADEVAALRTRFSKLGWL